MFYSQASSTLPDTMKLSSTLRQPATALRRSGCTRPEWPLPGMTELRYRCRCRCRCCRRRVACRHRQFSSTLLRPLQRKGATTSGPPSAAPPRTGPRSPPPPLRSPPAAPAQTCVRDACFHRARYSFDVMTSRPSTPMSRYCGGTGAEMRGKHGVRLARNTATGSAREAVLHHRRLPSLKQTIFRRVATPRPTHADSAGTTRIPVEIITKSSSNHHHIIPP